MPKIYELSSHVADLIAAGEVVERPGSVVKELLENAIDAGSSAVTIEIENGGMSFIRVADNGCGIGYEDVETAFLRHATSKIREETDLVSIGTLGFRGEAMAAIAAVSRIDLLTHAREEETGVSLSLDAGVPGGKVPAGCPEGTTIIVRNLFYNTPARMKFMKKDTAEGAYVSAVVQHASLSHPEVSIKLIKDGREELHTPGDGKLLSAIYSSLGRDFALGLTQVNGTSEDAAVSGFITKPISGRGTRGYQHFFVNGRYIKSRTMTAALEQAYKNQLMVGKFPGCVLHLNVKLNSVDVNVHPAKTEVKFVNERKIFDAVYYSVLAALDSDRGRPEMKEFQAAKQRHNPVASNQEFFQTRSAEAHRKGADLSREPAGFQTAIPPAKSELRDTSHPLQNEFYEIYRTSGATAGEPAEFADRYGEQPADSGHVCVDKSPLYTGAERERPTVPAETEQSEEGLRCETSCAAPEIAQKTWRILGEALGTYIVVEEADGLLLIDKHAAHERIIFDRLREDTLPTMSQILLTPVVTEPTREEAAALLENLPLLAEFGFEAEDFGGGSLIVRQAPWDIDAEEIASTLSELAGCILSAKRIDQKSARDELLHTIACKAAIKAGKRSSEEELAVLVEQVMADKVKYCPHGRPVAIVLTREQLGKQFKRA